MSSHDAARRRILGDVIRTDELGAFRERLRAELLGRLARAPAARQDLLDDVVGLAARTAFVVDVRAHVARRLGRGRRLLLVAGVCAAAMLIVALGARRYLAQREPETPDRRLRDSVPSAAVAPASRWLVSTKPFAPIASRRLSGDRVVVTRAQPPPRGASVERLDDDALMNLMRGRPCAVVSTADGRRELRLLDPRDERALFGPAPP